MGRRDAGTALTFLPGGCGIGAGLSSHHFVSPEMLSMDSTSRKEHHIINVLGWCGGEEKCRMSPPDREKTLRLFISGHFYHELHLLHLHSTRCRKLSAWKTQRDGGSSTLIAPSPPPAHLIPASPAPSATSTLHQRHLVQPCPGTCRALLVQPSSGVPPSLAMPNSSHRATNGRTYPATQDRSLKDVWRLSVVAGHRIPTSSTARASLPQGQPLGATLPPIPRLQPLPYL